MPLFGRKHETAPVNQAPVQAYNKPVHSHHTTSPRKSTSTTNSSRRNGGGGLFSRRRNSASSLSSSDLEDNTNRSSIGGLLHRNKHEDPSIVAARDRVIAAERAEKEADIALQQARTSVRAAHEHVRRLELEAEADAKAARLKQGQAKNLNKRAKPLGRHM